MPFIIDAHQDLAYSALTFGRNYLRAASETRQLEMDTPIPQRNGHTLLGWPDYQRGQIAVIFGVLFQAPRRYQRSGWESQVFSDTAESHRNYENQINYYRRLCDEYPDHFRLIRTKTELQEVLEPWKEKPAYLPLKTETEPDRAAADSEGVESKDTVTHPVGIVLLMEGIEGIRAPEEMEDWWERGVRIAGPVWGGTRFCGGMYEPGGFTPEGYELLEVMAELGMTLDVSHMNDTSVLQALERYEGPVIASHANARALLKGIEGERHLTDRAIRQLMEREGIIGVVPYNKFLRPDWSNSDDRQTVTLHTLAAHIDHICQLAGNAVQVGLGTDFDGGFGWPAVPFEINTIADLQKLGPVLLEYGYSEESIADIFGGNWQRYLERTLPGS
jgi:membrane dipeptidase